MAKAQMDSHDDLAAVLGASDTLPVIFVGSGFSRRYLGTPDWESLVAYAASLTKYPVDYYSSQLPGNTPKEQRLPLVSSLIAKEFHQVWWDSPAYEELRVQFAGRLPESGDPLKVMVARYIEGMKPLDDPALKDELERFTEAKIHAAITTNYDSLLESCFDGFQTYVGQQDVIFASPQYVGEIYKIHGSVEEPRSLVFTGEDYERYRERNPYLTAKMMTLFVEHPVIFFGYSLRDPHILELLSNLVSCLTEEQLETLNKRLIFVGRASDSRPKGLTSSTITVPGYTFGVQEFGVDDFGGVFDVLAELPEKFPVRLLRNLSEQVTQMAYSASSSERVHVLPLQENENIDDIQMVVGVGAFERLGLRGYTVYSRSEFFKDMLLGADDHNVEHLRDHLHEAFRNAKYSPIFYPRYLAEKAGMDFRIDELPARASSLLAGEPELRPYSGYRPDGWEAMGFAEILKRYPDHAANLATGCSYSEDDVIALREFLLEYFSASASCESIFAKAGAKYDRIVYGDDYLGDIEALRTRLSDERS
ncbi:SIR2 family protein [Leucobacter aridicollis]|uniref:SIR2 family protein n=1 Tax=Leucobacter aridicollis TaxID=283878 RepID=UPI002166EED5|nr:SIR2 family protein [Leucobacter aridicollis]MCS3429046.1 hypothetical protein [Leucobacter aridicollis]